MRRLVTSLAVTAMVACAAAPALASGGGPGGGGSGGGGGGGTGGGGSGGGKNDPKPPPVISVPVPTPTPGPPCASFVVANASTGTFSGNAAVWNDYVLHDCNTEAEDIDVEVIDQECETGQVDYDQIHLDSISAGSNLSNVVDYDAAAYGTSYCITIIARDLGTGVELDRTSFTAATPAH